MDLIIATGNKYKVQEMKKILKEYSINLKQKKIKLLEPDFDSQREVAKEKAKQAYQKLKKPLIAEDTGVYFEAYNNFPGMLAKRVYLGIGFPGLLALIKKAKNKKAYFLTIVCYYDGKKFKTFEGKLEGKLLDKTVSLEKDRLPYEKIFVPRGFKKALVDISINEKNKISHRAIATKKLGKWLKQKLGK